MRVENVRDQAAFFLKRPPVRALAMATSFFASQTGAKQFRTSMRVLRTTSQRATRRLRASSTLSMPARKMASRSVTFCEANEGRYAMSAAVFAYATTGFLVRLAAGASCAGAAARLD